MIVPFIVLDFTILSPVQRLPVLLPERAGGGHGVAGVAVVRLEQPREVEHGGVPHPAAHTRHLRRYR